MVKLSTLFVAFAVFVCVLGGASADLAPVASFAEFVNSNHLQLKFADGATCTPAEVGVKKCVQVKDYWTAIRQYAGSSNTPVEKFEMVNVLHECKTSTVILSIVPRRTRTDYVWRTLDLPCK